MSDRRPILVTGFEPFGDVTRNPSQAIVERLGAPDADHGLDLVTATLPTEYGEASRRIVALVGRHDPSAVLCLGVAADAHEIRVERVARNRDTSSAPDNAGEVRCGCPILDGGPDRLVSTLPVDALVARLTAAGLPATASSDAGGYVCNHVFYRLREALERRAATIPAGFVHVPDPRHADALGHGLDLDALTRGVRSVLAELAGLDGLAAS